MLPLSPLFHEEFQGKPNVEPSQPTIKLVDYLNLLSNSPPATGYSNKMWLLPHQSRVSSAALASEPIRAMLCDEVGLGKTLEALSVMEHFLTAHPHSNLTLSVPASLLVQWAKAINHFMDRDCFVYRSGKFEKWSAGVLIDKSESENFQPKHIGAANIRLFSSQWVRLQSNQTNNRVFSEVDMLVVDEAHNARCYNFKRKRAQILGKATSPIPEG